MFSFNTELWQYYIFPSIHAIDCYGLKALVSYGEINLFGLNSFKYQHFTMDIAAAFNQRNHKYYLIKKYIPAVIPEFHHILFDYCDCDTLVQLFEKPWDYENSQAMKRHYFWIKLKEGIEPFRVAKAVFNFTDEWTIETNQFKKPWEDSFSVRI